MNFKRAEQAGFDLFTADFMGSFSSGQTGLTFAEIEPWEVGESRRQREQAAAAAERLRQRAEREERERQERARKAEQRRQQEQREREQREHKREYKRQDQSRWEDPYTVLGIKYGCTDKEIRSAWAALVRTNHPDVGGTEEAIKRINRAYEALKRRS
jgi:DNA repair exonuclease SbcCD ATPase subunit